MFEVWNGVAWVDFSGWLRGLRHRVPSRGLEELEAELFLQGPSVGQRVRYRRNNVTRFEGVVYEVGQRHEGGRTKTVEIKAYTDLVLYDRHVVFREYAAGVKAGSIVKDIASLETGVDVSNVDESNTPALTQPWTVENVEALRVLMDVARGVNYWLRMKPGKKLYFKPKTAGTPSATVDGPKCVSVEYSEDRWKLKNRVIYVGAGGRILADVSEGAGDMPMTIHDPFLTDENEALRRAQTRLQLNREYGRSLRAVMMQDVFEALNVDLGDTVAVNLPSLGLNTNMYVVEIEYDPAARRYTVALGGRLELFEDFLSEALEGDSAARFGQRISIPEYVSTTAVTWDNVRPSYESVSLVYLNTPPLTLVRASNVTWNSSGEAVLSSGFTSGSFESETEPTGQLFQAFLRAEWSVVKNSGSVRVDVLDGGGNVLDTVFDAAETGYVVFKRWPYGFGGLTRRTASRWSVSQAAVSDVKWGILSRDCIRIAPSTIGTQGTATYPSTQNLDVDIKFARYFQIYLYADHGNDVTVTVRIHQDASNYLQGSLIAKSYTWQKLTSPLSTWTKTGNPEKMNYVTFSTAYSIVVDSDHVLLPFTNEKLRLRFTLSRLSAGNVSPVVKWCKIVWREGV